MNYSTRVPDRQRRRADPARQHFAIITPFLRARSRSYGEHEYGEEGEHGDDHLA